MLAIVCADFDTSRMAGSLVSLSMTPLMPSVGCHSRPRVAVALGFQAWGMSLRPCRYDDAALDQRVGEPVAHTAAEGVGGPFAEGTVDVDIDVEVQRAIPRGLRGACQHEVGETGCVEQLQGAPRSIERHDSLVAFLGDLSEQRVTGDDAAGQARDARNVRRVEV